MAAWLTPALKVVLPHLGTIVSAVVPAFTRKKADATANQMQLLQEQIAELQSAASQNTEYIKDLAAQLETTVSALEQTASIIESRIHRVLWFAAAAVVVSGISLIVVTLLIFAR